MRSFTHFRSLASSLFAGLMLLTFSSQITAQTHVVTVTEPAAIAGQYAAEMASFGRNFCNVTGELILARDASNATNGCNAITTDLTGKIAVIDRGGGCEFSTKVLNAQNRGAIAVIVFNNVSTAPVIPLMGTGAVGGQVTIPSFSMSLASANKIKPLLGSPVKVTIKNIPDFVDPSTVVWGNNPKEGEFDGGLNGWKSNTVSCSGKPNTATAWSYLPAGAFPSPCIVASPGTLTLVSPTRCNGAMIMNAATLDLASSTSCTNFAQGPCPAPHIGELISPTIKVTKGTPLNVTFYQSLTHFYDSEYFVDWSKDGGKTWVATQINQEIRPFEDNSDPYKSVRLIGSETADSIKIKFRYNGNYYHWAIDDVKLVKRESNNLAVTNEFYALSPNMQQPASQAETIPFGAAVENKGALAQPNLKLFISAIDTTNGSRYFVDSLVSNSIAPNQVDTAIFDAKFLPTKKGTYAMIYSAESDSTDYDPFDNLQGFFFRVTDTTFAKEFGATFYTLPGDNWDVNEPHSAAYGNSYYVVKGKGNYLRSVSFGVNNGSDLTGISLLVSLYTWDDKNQNALVEAGERTLVADNFYDIVGNETGARLITVPFPEPGEPAVQLQDTTTYLVMIEYFTGDDTDLELLLNDTYDRRPMLLTGFAVDKARYASFTALDSDLGTVTYSPTGYGLENVYVIRMNVGPLVITSDRDLPSLNNEFAISPNPAREKIFVNLALNEVAKQANVRIMDMAGRQIMEKVYTNVKRDQYQISVEGLPAGTYLMQVTTEKGTGTKKFMVAGK